MMSSAEAGRSDAASVAATDAAAGSADTKEVPREGSSTSAAASQRAEPLSPLLLRDMTPIALLLHAFRGGMRSFVLAYGIRVGVGFVLRLLQVFRRKLTLGRAVIDSIKGEEAVRFGAMFGAFNFIWRAVNNGLRKARGGVHDRWNGFISGSLAGLALLFEKEDRRLTISQQLAVRAVQSIYVALKDRKLVSVPYGSSIIFALSSAQVLYAYILHPTTIPKEYYSWMVKTARIPEDMLQLNRDLLRNPATPLDINRVMSIIRKHGGSQEAMDSAVQTIMQFSPKNPPTIPCEILHPQDLSCSRYNFNLWFKVFRDIIPVYLALTIVPNILLKLPQFVKDPYSISQKSLLNAMRSSSFLATFVTIYMMAICSERTVLLSRWFSSEHKLFYYIAGIVAGSSILIEHQSRRSELALYVLPRALQSLYEILFKHGLMIRIPHFDLLLCMLSMGVIMSFYQIEPSAVSPFIYRVMQRFFGKN